ncbi:MAG: class I SAM-dependent methyltransferase, partial [Candidatus Kariarchaeaceae archaeon]
MNISEESLDEDTFMSAKAYDKMIPWEERLKREIPLMLEYFNPGTVLDIACSSGRHSFELEKHGFSSLGIDVSKEMIFIAQGLKTENNAKSEFLALDVAKPIYEEIKQIGVETIYDNALFVGNAIANMGDYEAGKQVIYNIYLMLRPGGKLVCQTVFRPTNPYYMPLRKLDDNFLIQRIMVPVIDDNVEHNVDLHVNKISTISGKYESQKADNHFYMYTKQEFEVMVTQQGFRVLEVFGGYNREGVREADGATLVWILEKPEIPVYDETKALFGDYWKKINSKFDLIDAGELNDKIIHKASQVWQEALSLNNYRCIGSFRFLYPRIQSHPLYPQITANLAGKLILDLGCHMGTDLRQLIVDGADPEYLVGTDLIKRFWELGLFLFEDADSIQIKFVSGDITTSEILHFETKTGKFAQYVESFDIIHAGS